MRKAQLACITVFFLSATAVFAQSSAEVNGGIQFNFSNPGARSLALGGAFVGLADDATAAYTNPAGLTILQRPEISLEGRSNDFTHQFGDRGHVGLGGFPPDVSGEGVDTITGLQIGTAENTITDISFLSFVYPRERWAIAFYGHRLANFSADYRTQGALNTRPDDEDPTAPATFRFFPTTNDLDLDVTNYAGSFALKLTPQLSVGVGVNYLNFELESRTVRFGFGEESERFFEAPDYSPANAINFQDQVGDDSAVSFNAGLLWRPSAMFSGGIVYRQGQEFDVTAFSLGGIARARTAEDEPIGVGTFAIPTVIGAGVAIRPTTAFLLVADVNKVEYSEMSQNFVSLFGEDPSRYRVEDGYEYRLGAEYGFVQAAVPFFIRVGAWRDPAHRVVFDDPNSSQTIPFPNIGDDEIHYTGGIGLSFRRLELNAAIDVSDFVDTASISLVTRF